ncbi:MAG: helix-turn-helix protein [Rhodospirillales bacterium]|nr:helix-turn-helix protein [Rhodospirillales bacterium]
MKSWKCSTDLVSGEERERVWGEALHQISLPATHVQDHSGFHGDVSSVVSPLGIEFSRVSSSAQTLSGACLSRPPCLWLALPVEGVFQLADGSDSTNLRLGDILYGPTGRDSTLKLPDHFVMLYIRIPQTMLYPRLLNLQVLPMGTLTGRAAVNRIFANLLHSIVDDLEELTDEHIRPIEVALSEFVISSLAESSAMSCFDVAGASNFHRISQAIELQLGDGDLTLHQIAEQQHVSARYIQKLFQQAGLSFSHYLRQRRLEHCHADLGSAAHRNLSISDICFRWGFNDAAHFSRSFRADYGMTPRAFRQERLNAMARAH